MKNKFIRVTPGGRHAIWELPNGLLIRKPIGKDVEMLVDKETYPNFPMHIYPQNFISDKKKTSWWKRLIKFIFG